MMMSLRFGTAPRSLSRAAASSAIQPRVPRSRLHAASPASYLCWEQAQNLLSLKPTFDKAGYKLVVVSIGTPQGGRQFCTDLPFPPELLYLDPERALYRTLALKSGFWSMFSSEAAEAWRSKDLAAFQGVLKQYKFISPPSLDATTQQGGLYVFDGPRVLYAHQTVSGFEAASLSRDWSRVRSVGTEPPPAAISAAAGLLVKPKAMQEMHMVVAFHNGGGRKWEHLEVNQNGKVERLKLHVKKGDFVQVIAGKDKGKTGTITKVVPKLGMVFVEGVNIKTKNMAPRAENEKGQQKQLEFPIDHSNVQHYSKEKQVRSRVGYKFNAEGKKVRYLIKTGEEV
ncbi:hypothetical protein QJQ45_009049 [Haematococcus lacustris]|nr:hypothetical protein QJQ45_009049 [Haematococcus lacustris]